MQICLEVCAKLLTDRQTNKQRRKHNLLGGGNNTACVLLHDCISSFCNLADFGSYADPNRQEAVSRQVHALESVLSKMLPRNLVMSVKWPTKSKETAVKRQLPELQLEPEISCEYNSKND